VSKLFRFRYLRFRHLLVLTLILVLSSALFSVTALSFLGFYKSFNAYLSEDDSIIAVYNVQSRTPFTGIIPAYLTSQVSAMDGVLACSPEVITPCIVNNQSFFIRGIVPDEFKKLNTLEMIEGGNLKQSGINSLLLGKSLADRLNVKVNDKMLVLGVLADRYLELQVTGVYLSHSSMDDEALVLLNVGQWLRGTSYNYVSMVRVKTNPSLVSSNDIYQELAKNASSVQSSSQPATGQATKYQEMIPWSAINFQIGQIGVGSTQSLMKSYLDRYGITEQVLIVLSVMVFLFSGVTIAVASQTFMQQHKRDIVTLWSLGVSRKNIKIDVVSKLLPVALLASTLGLLITGLTLSLLQRFGYLQVLSHNVTFSFDPLIAVLNFLLILSLVIIGIISSDLP
jgi:ABC-type lipoprotein release transport system permease subunit